MLQGIVEVQSSECKLSHKKYRLLLKKKKRSLKRQCLALQRDEKIQEELRKLESSPSNQYRKEREEVEHKIQEEYDERERRRLHYLWLQREEEAMAIFKRCKEHEDKIKAQKEEEARKARKDLEKLEKKETDEKKSKEDALKKVIDNLPEGNEPWHNPIAPARPEVADMREICHFFSKTGTCRFGERCSRQHLRPESSRTIILRGMFTHFCMEEMFHDEYDTDIGLEFEESDMYQYFLDFYEDALPEFKKIGKVVQFKVCCNQEQHLRGNVYVQYEKENEAEQALKVFNGRFYGGKQLTCEYTCVTTWKKAICGLFVHKRCPKGRTCNFLHVFNNPRGEFKQADRDFVEWDSNRTRTPGSFRNDSHSTRISPGSRRSSRRSHSRTPPYSNSRRLHSKTPPHSNSRRSHSRTPPHRSSKRSHSRTPPRRSSRRSRSRTPPHRSSKMSHSRSPQRKKRSRSRTPKRLSSRSPPESSRRTHSKTLDENLRRSVSMLPPSNVKKFHDYLSDGKKRHMEQSRKKKSRRKSPSPDVQWVEKSIVI